MTLLNLTFLILNLNYMIDHGRRASLDEIKQRIDRGDVLDWIGRWFNRRADACPYLHDRGAYEEITLGLRQMLYMATHDERWQWGVVNNGLCLLLAWTTATRLAGTRRMYQLRRHGVGVRGASQSAVQDVQQPGQRLRVQRGRGALPCMQQRPVAALANRIRGDAQRHGPSALDQFLTGESKGSQYSRYA